MARDVAYIIGILPFFSVHVETLDSFIQRIRTIFAIMGLSQETETLLSYKCYEYGDHDRQRIGAWHRNIPQNDGRWVV